ncbi:MAG TPA: XRE family transcriptional regulator [Thermoanaerobaculia bacterium]|nr:XRE family transcriptional regulator [Thermoanaerobaculia bacterium]
MAPIVSWRERLRVAIDASGRTQGAIAASAGVSPETLSRVLSGVHAQPAFETVVRIAHAVGESVGTLLDEPAFILDGEQRAELRRVINYLNSAIRMSPAIDQQSAPNAVLKRTADVPRGYHRRGARLVFQAIDDSMVDAGIVDGDLLFVVPTRALRAAAKHIIVCRFANVTLVKELELRAGRIRLISRNERYAPIEVDEENDLQLVGIVIGRLGSVLPSSVSPPL